MKTMDDFEREVMPLINQINALKKEAAKQNIYIQISPDHDMESMVMLVKCSILKQLK